MPVTDPRDPAIEKWLRSLEPRLELVMRFAMRRRFGGARADRKIDARVDKLRQQFDEDALALILTEANLMSERLDEEFLGAVTPKSPPPRKRRRR